ncbi:SHOCT domain-containing protein [Nitrosopumilus sp. S6]
MKQIKNQKIDESEIEPLLSNIPKINQEIEEVKKSFSTNSTIVKDTVRKETEIQLKNLNEKISRIQDQLSTSEYWNRLKNSTKSTSKIIQNATKDGLKESKGPIDKFKKFITGMIYREEYPGERYLKLLTKLGELKEKGLITQEEFNSKKKKILAKI